MARMASEHAEQNTAKTLTELTDEFESIIRKLHPDESLAMNYVRCYGIVVTNLTTDQMQEIIDRWKKAL